MKPVLSSKLPIHAHGIKYKKERGKPMIQCEGLVHASVMAGNCRAWIAQKQCPNKAKYQVTKQRLYLGGKTSISTRHLCGRCAKPQLEYRYKLDNHIFYNDASLDHTYPIIEPIAQERVTA